MSKKTKKGCSLFLGATLLFTGLFASCSANGNSPHVHTYAWHSVKDATCSETGIIEGICSDCGEKSFQEIQKKPHIYEDGLCKVCEALESENLIKISDSNLGWSLSNIHERLAYLGREITGDFLYSQILGEKAKNLSVSKNGNLQATLISGSEEYDVTIFDVREDFVTDKKNDSYVYALRVSLNGKLSSTLADGTSTEYGYIKELAPSSQKRTVARILLNKQNQLFVIYNNDTAELVGKLPNAPLNINEDSLIYQKEDNNTYSVCDVFSNNLTHVTVPQSHRGLPIETIQSYAFRKHTNLKWVILPTSIKTIDWSSFPSGTKILTEHETIPSNWTKSALLGNYKVYTKNQWALIDGEPMLRIN